MSPAAVDDTVVVQTAAEAAEGVIFSRIERSNIADMDVTVTFEDGQLEVDVYLNAPEAPVDAQQVATDATRTAREAVDDLLG